jgi:phosphohistidine phosphatase
MRLYLLRHAIAVPRGTPGYPQDAQRPLTEEGHAQARQVAEGLRRLRIPVELIVTSPYVRAAQTAEHVARVFGPQAVVKDSDKLVPEAEPEESSLFLRSLSSHEHVLMVGHDPHLSLWLAMLVTGEGTLRCLFKKAGAACVEVNRLPPPQGSGTLRWLLTPKQLVLMGRAG